jgi:uncharacterized protein
MARHTGYAHLPLHPGRAPAWLFTRMTRLAREIAVHIVADQGPEQLLRRLSDPFWFQAFGCVLGFDWHSSGVTTTVTGALKEGLANVSGELGLYAQGGKGAASRKTPAEIAQHCDRLAIDPQPLVYASRMAAKVDGAAVQDGYQLYHHAFFFTRGGHWCVVQQGMNEGTRTARRYHWLSESLTSFVNEPHAAICSDSRVTTLNLVALENAKVRDASLELATSPPTCVMDVVRRYGAAARPRKIRRGLIAGRLPFDEPQTKIGLISTDAVPQMRPGFDPAGVPALDMPAEHRLALGHLDPRHLESVLLSTYARAPQTFEALLGLEGVGPRTLRALALVSEVIYGTPLSTRDPARFAFAHGGKDGTPFPVDRQTYDRTIDVLHRAMASARIDRSEKVDALKRLGRFARTMEPRATRL